MKAVKWWPGWLIEYLPILTVLVIAIVCYSGCIWLAVPSLVYEGYKYQHQSNTNASPDPSVGSSKSQQPTSRDSASSDHSIE